MVHKKSENKDSKLELTVAVTGPIELGRLIREVAEIEESLLQLGLREGGEKVKLPQTTRLMDQLVEHNKLNLLHEDDRKRLREFLDQVRVSAPVLHMSFSADPSINFLEELMTWLRREIHPEVLLTVGLQPNLGAGCILRTTNKQFDFSLRQDFIKKRDLLFAGIVGRNAEAQS